ncbi:hypothetical protein [Nostocoides veronense]|uniref:Uncharacterized protein n=1 Tax=Nostocoides veronense TaxID=330836 RepID=A0ABP4Y7D9_9MICO
MAAKLIRRFKGRLVLTPLGRKAVRDPQVLRVVVARYLLETGEAFDQQAAALALLLVAARWTPTGEEYNARAVEVGRLLEALGWRTASRFSFSVGVQAGRRVDRSLAPGKGSGPRAAAAYAEPAAIALARQAIFLE